MKLKLAALITLAASPALAASSNPFSGAFWHLDNTNLIVLIAFIIFLGVLIKFKVPGMLTGMLDQRAVGIKSDLDEAKALREEAQTLLASYERKQREVQAQADRIVESAKDEATRAAEQAKADIATSVTRRLAAAEDQIESAKASNDPSPLRAKSAPLKSVCQTAIKRASGFGAAGGVAGRSRSRAISRRCKPVMTLIRLSVGDFAPPDDVCAPTTNCNFNRSATCGNSIPLATARRAIGASKASITEIICAFYTFFLTQQVRSKYVQFTHYFGRPS